MWLHFWGKRTVSCILCVEISSIFMNCDRFLTDQRAQEIEQIPNPQRIVLWICYGSHLNHLSHGNLGFVFFWGRCKIRNLPSHQYGWFISPPPLKITGKITSSWRVPSILRQIIQGKNPWRVKKNFSKSVFFLVMEKNHHGYIQYWFLVCFSWKILGESSWTNDPLQEVGGLVTMLLYDYGSKWIMNVCHPDAKYMFYIDSSLFYI